MFSKSKFSLLEVQTEAVLKVLNKHGVFSGLEGKWLEAEERGFASMVKSHAEEPPFTSYLEMTYPSGVRLIVNTTTVGRKYVYSDIKAYDHPWENPKIDYDALNRDLAEVLR